MSDFTDVYKELIILQYYPKAKAQGEINLWSSEFENVYSFLNEFFNQFDLDVATGDRLDKIGKIVGISRIVEGGAAKKFFGYLGALNVLGYDDGRYFVEGDDLYTDSELTDGQYRLFIKAKITKNNVSAIMVDDERSGLQSAIQSLFNGEAYVIDNQDMSLNLYISSDLNTDDLTLIIQADLLPKPQAVRYRWIVQETPCDTTPTLTSSTLNANGSSNYIHASEGITEGLSKISISFWIKPEDLLTTQRILSEEYNTFMQFHLSINSPGTLTVGYRTTDSGTDYSHVSTSNLIEGVWQNVTIALDVATTVKIYINGVEDLSSPTVTSAINNTARNDKFFLKRGSDNSRFYQGGLANMIFWRGRVLGAPDAAALYNAGNAICFDSIEDKIPGILTNLGPFFPFENHTGFTGQELIDQSTYGSVILSNGGSTPFDATGLDIECDGGVIVCDGTFGYEGAPNASGYDSGIYADVLTLP